MQTHHGWSEREGDMCRWEYAQRQAKQWHHVSGPYDTVYVCVWITVLSLIMFAIVVWTSLTSTDLMYTHYTITPFHTSHILHCMLQLTHLNPHRVKTLGVHWMFSQLCKFAVCVCRRSALPLHAGVLCMSEKKLKFHDDVDDSINLWHGRSLHIESSDFEGSGFFCF